MRQVSSVYYKYSPNGGLMSGIKPQDTEENTRFVQCTFHCNMWGEVVFKNCIFEDCDGMGMTIEEGLKTDARNVGNQVTVVDDNT